MATTKILGGKCKVYHASAALTAVGDGVTFPSGTWTEYSKVIEVSISDAKEMADASDRTSLTDKHVAIGRKVEVTISMHQDPSDTQYLALAAAYSAGTTIPLAFASGDKTITTVTLEGFSANWTVGDKSRDEKRKDFNVVKFKLSVEDYFTDFVIPGA